MQAWIKWASGLTLVLLASVPAAQTRIDLEPFIADNRINTIQISPNGEHYAMTVPIEGQTGLAITRRSDGKLTGSVRFRRGTHVANFWWVGNDRVVMSLAETFGTRDEPVHTGELWGVNADGSQSRLLVGWRTSDGPALGTRIGSPRGSNMVAAEVIDLLPGDDKSILVAIRPFTRDPFVRAEKMDVFSGRRAAVAQLPVPSARFLTDSKGEVRFGLGATSDNYSQLFYRASNRDEWQQLNHERDSGRIETPLGFSPDDRVAYLRVSQASGPDAIMAMDIATGERRQVARDDAFDPWPIYHDGHGAMIGVRYLTAPTRMAFFDDSSADTRLYRSLAGAFAGQQVIIASSTSDGRFKVVLVESDIDPGSFYLFDTQEKKAEFLFARSPGIDPTQMSPARAITLKARDGMELHGFLTVPGGGDGKNLPLVVLPHGGPFNQFDDWTFETDTQLLAKAGYAVLRLNFRGSGNHGYAYRQAGARQWGAKMQDDLTDATRWAIAEGVADPARICIYGASYGGYASLMGVAKEPDLYRCAVGYVGVYDLTRWNSSRVETSRSTQTWRGEWIGSDNAQLAAVSPNRIASRIKVPVFLAAGGEDLQVPFEHSELMEKALKDAGVPVETLYYPKEGHGFYQVEHRREFYQRLLDFLDRHIGAKAATAKP